MILRKKKPRGFQMEKVGNALRAAPALLHCIIRCALSYFEKDESCDDDELC
jgi:hypothetical protein